MSQNDRIRRDVGASGQERRMHMTMLQFSVPGIAALAVNVRQLEASARKTGMSVVQPTYRK